MKAETVSIVNDLKKVTVNQVTYEAITNSIHAGADLIEVSINSLNKDLDDIESQYVSEIRVTDNGHGFLSDDLESFQTYRSRHKKIKFGAKGVGRFLYLKLFENVHICSLDKEINFNLENDVKIVNTNSFAKKTSVHLATPKDGYQINKQTFVEGIKLHFLPLFKLIKSSNSNRIVTITVKFNGNIFENIRSEDIPDFQDCEFSIGEHIFMVSYLLNHSIYKSGDGAYCADGRVVCFNSQLESKKRFKAFKGVNFFYLLSAPYFDENLNDERDELNINAKRKSQQNWVDALSWEDINTALSEKIKQICLEHGINIDEQANRYLYKAVEKAPFLSSYIKRNDLMLDEDDLLRSAQKHFNEDKELIRNDKSKLTDSERQLLINRVVQAELAEYVFDRQKTINKLKVLEGENALEKEIHNLFMKRFSHDESRNYKSSNLWLFDDRFMSYDKVFSDKQIKDIFPELYQHLDKPDILSICSNTFKKDEITDVVIIELKRPEAQNDVAVAESELLRYSRYVNESDLSNIRIWTYAFIKFDDEANLELDDKSYNKIPVQNGWPIRYRYYEKRNTIINFIDYKALAYDAESRNNTFLNILKAKHYENKP